MNLIEEVRGKVVRGNLSKLQGDWPQRKSAILAGIAYSGNLTATDVIRIGDVLSSAFLLPQFKGVKNNTSMSRGGSVWENLVCWYLNMCLAGTPAIALKSSWIPTSIKNALSVTSASQGGASLQSDADVLVLHLPVLQSANATPAIKTITEFFSVVEQNFTDCSVVLVSTKTNWSDMIQTPVLWNFLLTAAHKKGFSVSTGTGPHQLPFHIGQGTHHPSDLRAFSYAFVTVPTGDKALNYGQHQAPVVRANTMTGGAFWGRQKKPGVIRGLSEFFMTNFNALNGNFPAGGSIGQAFAAEASMPSNPLVIDVGAFSFP